MLDHHVFIWTDDEFIRDVMCFAVQRLGYSCSLFSSSAWRDRAAATAVPHTHAYYLFIVGPQVPLAELEAVLQEAQQADLACEVKVVLLADQTTDAPTPTAADEHAYHRLPLNLRALHTTLQAMLTPGDSS
jgi:DNA-binding NtrC family response regulator